MGSVAANPPASHGHLTGAVAPRQRRRATRAASSVHIHACVEVLLSPLRCPPTLRKQLNERTSALPMLSLQARAKLGLGLADPSPNLQKEMQLQRSSWYLSPAHVPCRVWIGGGVGGGVGVESGLGLRLGLGLVARVAARVGVTVRARVGARAEARVGARAEARVGARVGARAEARVGRGCRVPASLGSGGQSLRARCVSRPSAP